VFPPVPGAAAGSLAYTPMGARAGGRQPPTRQGSNPRRFGI